MSKYEILAILAVVASLSVAYGSVFAEEWKQPIPFDAETQKCQLIETPEHYVYNCQATAGKDNAFVDKEEAKPGVPVEEPTPETEDVKKDDKSDLSIFDRLEADLKKAKESGIISPAEEKLLEVLEAPRYHCYEGNLNSGGIQTLRAVEDPQGVTYNATDNYNLDSNYWLKEMLLRDQECLADIKLDNEVHSEYHFNKYFEPHNMKKFLIPAWVQSITDEHGIEYPVLTAQTFAENDEKIIQNVCYGGVWKNVDKIQFGCPEDALYQPTEHDHDYQGIQSQLNPIPDLINHPLIVQANEFKSGNEGPQLQKNIKVNQERDQAKRANYGGNN